MKAIVREAALFVDANDSRLAAEEVLSALMHVRKAQRHTCKSESRSGRDANGALHDAEGALERALKVLGATTRTT